MKKCVLILCVFWGLLMANADAEKWVVDTSGVEGESLQVAIDKAWNDPGIDTVVVKNGKYHLAINGDTGLIMRDSVVLISEGGAYKCTLTAIKEDFSDTAWHVIFCDTSGFKDTASHAALIKGFTIKDGKTEFGSPPHNQGGGIFLYRASPVIESCNIVYNTAYNGAGIYIEYASPILRDNIIAHNYAYYFCGGIHIADHSSPYLSGNIIKDNSGYYAGGICIIGYSRPELCNNIIEKNWAGALGAGIYILASSSATLNNNIIKNNHADYKGGGICILQNSSAILRASIIKGNSVYHHGGALCISENSWCVLSNNVIIDNKARDYGGCVFICDNASLLMKNCVIAMNKALEGGVIFESCSSKTVIDSCFIIDNGSHSSRTGLAFIDSTADSGVTFKISNSNVYYNTYQPDTEIYNLSSVMIDLKNNFWWDTTDSEISSLIYGLNDHSNWRKDFVSGVPGEPLQVDSVKVYIDSMYSELADNIWEPCTLYLRLFGRDRLRNVKEIAIAIVKTSIYQVGIAVSLLETDTSSGIYEGEIYVKEVTGKDTIQTDDIYQRIKVDSIWDTIIVFPNIDVTKRYRVIYKGPDIDVSYKNYDFGSINVGDSADFEFYCMNKGIANLIIDSAKVDSPFFVVSPVLPCSIGSGDSVKMVVRFIPRDTGNYTDTLKIYSNDPNEQVIYILLSGSAVSPFVKEIKPVRFEFKGVTPNPLCNHGKIHYAVPEKSHINIRIYDVTGRFIKEIINEESSPGFYDVEFKINLPEGVYFIVMEADKFKSIRKFLVIKW